MRLGGWGSWGIGVNPNSGTDPAIAPEAVRDAGWPQTPSRNSAYVPSYSMGGWGDGKGSRGWGGKRSTPGHLKWPRGVCACKKGVHRHCFGLVVGWLPMANSGGSSCSRVRGTMSSESIEAAVVAISVGIPSPLRSKGRQVGLLRPCAEIACPGSFSEFRSDPSKAKKFYA